jgi:four helix bundle protein
VAASHRNGRRSTPNHAQDAAARDVRHGRYLAFLHIARGSLSELKTQLVLARAVGYLADADLSKSDLLSDEVGRLLNAVIRGLRRRQMAAV